MTRPNTTHVHDAMFANIFSVVSVYVGQKARKKTKQT